MSNSPTANGPRFVLVYGPDSHLLNTLVVGQDSHVYEAGSLLDGAGHDIQVGNIDALGALNLSDYGSDESTLVHLSISELFAGTGGLLAGMAIGSQLGAVLGGLIGGAIGSIGGPLGAFVGTNAGVQIGRNLGLAVGGYLGSTIGQQIGKDLLASNPQVTSDYLGIGQQNMTLSL